MSKTPKTDAAIHKFWMGGSWSIEFADFARQLETEHEAYKVVVVNNEKQLKAQLGQLETENAELRASLKECVEYAERYEDSGPFGEGWQSERLVKACQRARALLANVEGK